MGNLIIPQKQNKKLPPSPSFSTRRRLNGAPPPLCQPAPVFVGRTVVGYTDKGVFTQHITDRHIFRQYNAKGIDVNLFWELQASCHTWKLIFKHTGQVLTINFYKLNQVGFETDTGAGRQILVKLSEFTEETPVLQRALL